MRILMVKMSSLGDIIHTFPALTDAAKNISGIEFDWVVEESLKEMPTWHPSVKRVIPIALRRWRKTPIASWKRGEVKQFLSALRSTNYDMIIDAQGLIKSACVTRLARGTRVGLNSISSREPLSHLGYQKTFFVDKNQHAIQRTRSLFAQALGYALPETIPDYGLQKTQFPAEQWNGGDYVVFLHGTTWTTKLWPENHWVTLANMFAEKGFAIRLFSGNAEELARAQRLVSQCPKMFIQPKSSLSQLANILKNAKGVVTVDTGLGHMAAAFDVPTVSLYGPTDPKKVGTLGARTISIQSPFSCVGCHKGECQLNPQDKSSALCMDKIDPRKVYEEWKRMMNYKL